MITLREFQNVTLNIGCLKTSEKRLIITNDFNLYCDDGFFVADLILKERTRVLKKIEKNNNFKELVKI